MLELRRLLRSIFLGPLFNFTWSVFWFGAETAYRNSTGRDSYVFQTIGGIIQAPAIALFNLDTAAVRMSFDVLLSILAFMVLWDTLIVFVTLSVLHYYWQRKASRLP